MVDKWKGKWVYVKQAQQLGQWDALALQQPTLVVPNLFPQNLTQSCQRDSHAFSGDSHAFSGVASLALVTSH